MTPARSQVAISTINLYGGLAEFSLQNIYYLLRQTGYKRR